ncbi:hypothetical protein PBRA_009638 [Plasmodiophora brassicae]|uniref:Integrase zinc-binding domain-containing protein n=1 Tax=Plasmodiophora brassicae TaxID=37360 RepID=A0A0G4IJW2_PLABS|nr:hypothetical protein PBRA_009638 [Plasmodiophora brassicae]
MLFDTLHLQGFSYKMKEIAGTDNSNAHHADGRFASHSSANPEFSWPTEKEIRDSQRFLSRDEKIEDGVYFDEADRLWKNESKAVLIPCHQDCKSLRLRILVIGHCASAGHRASEVTKQMITERFFWTKINQDIEAMCQQCLHCITTRGGKKVPRPLGEVLHGHQPFDVLTMDYLYVEPVRGADHKYKYILLLKDDFSGYVRLIPSAEATSRVAA